MRRNLLSCNDGVLAESRVLLAASNWTTVFEDDFRDQSSWNNWELAQRKDYNSTLTNYTPENASIGTRNGRDALIIRAFKDGNEWKSAFVGSKQTFKPGVNEEVRISSKIKLIAREGDRYVDFDKTYGMWPAFWTSDKKNWPVKGEIDIFEGFSFGDNTKKTSNVHHGVERNVDLIPNAAERKWPQDVGARGSEVGGAEDAGWDDVELVWRNTNGKVSLIKRVNGQTVATYTNAADPNLKLEEFGAHNIFLNMAVGSTKFNIFDNSKIDSLSEAMMWVDSVKVEKRRL